MWNQVIKINQAISGFVWGAPMLILMMGVGIYLSFCTKGIQLRRFGYAMRNTIGKVFEKQTAKKGEITPFQAVTTALAATVGIGNIAGVTWAITAAGPGVLFWLWVSAIVGMCTKYAEVVLAIRFRERNQLGEWVGGPMYYIRNGLGKKWNPLAVLFSIFGALAAFGIGNAVQVGNIANVMNTAIQSVCPGATAWEKEINLAIGILVASLTAFVLIGGLGRIGAVTECLVPVMALTYILACVAVILANLDQLIPVLVSIFRGAFKPAAVVGGAGGFTLLRTITWGVRRGVFSNEAGLGSAPIAHASSSETNPVKQGMYGIFEVFMDTIVICTLTGLSLLMSGIELSYGTIGTMALNAKALGTVFGEQFGIWIIAVGGTLFAIATIFGWALYGTRCCEFVFGSKSVDIYHILYVMAVLTGATMELRLVWDIADTLNGLMAIPNLVALIGLSDIIVNLGKNHFSQRSR